MIEKDVKVSNNCFVPYQNIKCYMSYEGTAAKRLVMEKRQQDACMDRTCGKRIKSVIALLDGSIILTNVSVETIYRRIWGTKLQEEECL